jgi:uncharacterized NAD(P)/FAD-binding protein YdhS
MKTIGIIGGGFSGTMTAIQLLLKSKDVSIKLINSGHPLLSGVAYSTKHKEHLLNVPAGKMSAYNDQPDHFTNWLLSKAEYKELISDPVSAAYVPRMLYGRYLDEIFSPFLKNDRLEIIDSKALDVDYINNSYKILLENKRTIEASSIVYAMGNFLPAAPKISECSALENDNYFPDPWNDSYLKGISSSENILLMGTGLSMIDCMLSLTANGYEGKIHAVSPRGYLPETHTAYVKYRDFYDQLKNRDLYAIFRTIRKHVQEASMKNIPWQSVIDAVRPYATDIWLNLSFSDKRQFISHLRHIWGVARHRLPSPIHTKMMTLIRSGKMEVTAGRLLSIDIKNDNFLVSVKRRKDQKLHSFEISRIVNCTGPQINFSEINDELIRNLISKSLLLPDDLKMGIRALPDGRVLNYEGDPVLNSYAVGSLLRGVLWETTSVPDLRINAENVAKQIIASID